MKLDAIILLQYIISRQSHYKDNLARCVTTDDAIRHEGAIQELKHLARFLEILTKAEMERENDN